MAPAGGFDALQAALDSGADSIYFGVDQLNMRARATMNFTLGDLEEIAQPWDDEEARNFLKIVRSRKLTRYFLHEYDGEEDYNPSFTTLIALPEDDSLMSHYGY